jgi:hypothetical protein
VLCTNGPESSRLALAEGPGITLDESFNVETGVYLVRSFEAFGLASLHPDSVREIWGAPEYNPDHPPLARLALGLSHDWNQGGGELLDAAARPASAFAFALTVLIASLFAGRWFGPVSAAVAGLSLILMPRQFGHAHLASLETFIGLTYALCILWVADRWFGPTLEESPPQAPRWRAGLAAGLLFGLALLTKIQAVFLAPAVVLWALWRFRARALPSLVVFGVVGFLVLFAGWPWLWLSPIEHLREYFARTTERQTLYCFYWGERWADRDVPWHYPWVLFGVTVPIGLHLLGALGVGGWSQAPGTRQTLEPCGLKDPRLQLVLLGMAIPLIVFSIPGIRVYDGERLFGVVYPLWAVVIARGAGIAWHVLRRRLHRQGAALVAALFLGTQAWGLWQYHPCELSFYNLAVGGLRCADKLGFERTYWADSLTDSFQREIVKKIPHSAVIDVAPVLHPFYLDHLLQQSPILQEAGITLRPYDDKQPGGSPIVLLFHRKADPWESLLRPPRGTEKLAEFKRDGVALASLYRLPE